jgi:hypothetical protein
VVIEGPVYEEYIAQLALLALADNEYLKTKSNEKAESFINNLLETINPMLLSYKSVAVDREASKSRKALLQENSGKVVKEIYDLAMRLRVEMNLKTCTYTFFWPACDQLFDEATMDPEVHQQRAESSIAESWKKFRVAATVLPGIRRIEPPDPGSTVNPKQEPCQDIGSPDPDGTVIYRALVYLRDTRA